MKGGMSTSCQAPIRGSLSLSNSTIKDHTHQEQETNFDSRVASGKGTYSLNLNHSTDSITHIHYSQRTTMMTKILLLSVIAVTFTQAWMTATMYTRTSLATIREKFLAKRHGSSHISNGVSSSSSMMTMMMAMPLEGATTTAATAAVVASPLSSSVFLVANQVESWREYVPLVVSALVIIDIAMGRPVANAIMEPLQQATTNDSAISNETPWRRQTIRRKNVSIPKLLRNRHWIEPMQVWNCGAISDENKSDAQRLQELRRQMDEEIVKVDAALKERQRKIDAGDY
jgi:hypothetical protein